MLRNLVDGTMLTMTIMCFYSWLICFCLCFMI